MDGTAFEGVIPEGYGNDEVIMRDRDTWAPLGEEDAAAGLAAGYLGFDVTAERMTGRSALVCLKPRAGERTTKRLPIKDRDEHARPGSGNALVADHPTSIVTGWTIDDIAAGERVPLGGDGGAEAGASEHHRAILLAVLDASDDGHPPISPGDEVLRAHQRIDALLASSASRTVVRVEPC